MADRSPLRRKLIRWFAYPAQAVGAYLLYGLLAVLPIDAASAFGGWLLRTVGPWNRADRIARRNLQTVFPEKSRKEIDRIVRGVWDNTGRVIGEWPHLTKIEPGGPDGRIEVVGGEILAEAAAAGGPVITITGHYGSLEVAAYVSNRLGRPTTGIYRPAQNPWVNKLVQWSRGGIAKDMLPKGPATAIGALEILKAGGWLGVPFDQKFNEGVPVPFFGREAMTSPLAARMALSFRCPLIPIRADRVAGAHYRVIVCPPLELPDTGDRKKDRETLLLAMNRMLEDWIREKPEQWFWVHKRWPD